MAVVVLQVPAQSFTALDLPIFDKREDVCRLPARRSIPQILMRPFVVIVVRDEFRDEVAQVLLTADDEVSGAEELHPRALSEPYVSVSTHTAPAIRRHKRLCLCHEFLPFDRLILSVRHE